ncbi:unnamed protein product [Laminaria digitata]
MQDGIWDIAERTIDSTSRGCRGKLQDALERHTANLSAACRAEVGRTLERQSRRGDDKPRRGEKGGAGNSYSPTSSSTGRKDGKLKAETNPATIVLTFVTCALVAFAAMAYFVSGGRSQGGRHTTRSGKRLHKKDRARERAKKRR